MSFFGIFHVHPSMRNCKKKGHDKRKRRTRRHCVIGSQLETLEGRRLLSAIAAASQPSSIGEALAQPVVEGAFSSTPVGLTPDQLRSAYGIASLRPSNGFANDGSGQTIAIVMYNSDPNIFNDVDQFDKQYSVTVSGTSENLYNKYGSAGPTNGFLTVVNQIGQASPLPAPDYGAAIEISLDVEMAHAMAPGAKILLVEANSATINLNNTPSDLYTAVDTARNWPGVSVVSMSWGLVDQETKKSEEYPLETGDDYHFTTPAGHTGVTFIASSGDYASPAGYPAYSPNILAVGGTNLTTDVPGHYLGETGWSQSGGGQSLYEPEPSYQRGVQSSNQREAPDVSFDAGTGVSIYDSYNVVSPPPPPWASIGGTSVGAPAWAGLTADINQARLTIGGQTLDGPTQLLPDLYGLPEGDYNDVTSGSNGGHNAGPGYDEVTGLGTPIAAAALNPLAYPNATINRASDPSGDRIDVSRSGSTTQVTVNGTIVFSANSSGYWGLNILGSNNDSLTVDFSGGNPLPYGEIFYNGGGGTNTLTVKADANFTLGNNILTLSGNGSGRIATANVAAAQLTTIYDGSNPAHSITVNGWYGTAAANLLTTDSASLYAPIGSSGNNFTAYPTSSTLSGTGYTYSTSGGATIYGLAASSTDTATLYSSSTASGNFFAHARNGSQNSAPLALFQGSTWDIVAGGFSQAAGISQNSSDVAYLDDQYSSGTVFSHATYSLFQNAAAGYDNIANGFHHIYMTSYNSSDVAHLDDQYASGPSTVFSHATYSFFQGNDGSYQNIASAFHEVAMQSYNTSDVAYLDDQFASVPATVYSAPTNSIFEGNSGGSFVNIAASFQRVYMTSYNAEDVANLDDQGSSGGHFYAYPTYAYIQGPGFYNYASGFHLVVATSDQPTVDVADLYDTAGGATLGASGSTAILTYANGNKILAANYAAVNGWNLSQSADTYTPAAEAAGYIYFVKGSWVES